MSVVGNNGGRKKILWGPLLKLALLLIPLSTAATSGAYVVFAERWNPLAAYLGLAGGFAVVLVILLSNFFTPVFRLPFVK